MSTWAVSYRSSAVSTSASLSKAIRDGRYEDLQELLDDAMADRRGRDRAARMRNNSTSGRRRRHGTTHGNHHPLWEANSRGWTPMHVAAIGSMTMPLRWWNWILRQQQQHNAPSLSQAELWTRQTDQGQTVVELFFRTALDPLPWCKQSLKEKAGRLKEAIERILTENDKNRRHDKLHPNIRCDEKGSQLGNQENCVEEESMLWILRELILAHDAEGEDVKNGEEHDIDIILVHRFWKKLTGLLFPHRSQNLGLSILDVLASLPWCPQLVGRLAIALFPEQVEGNENVADEPSGKDPRVLPLHRCVRSFGGSEGGMLQVLCEAHPLASSIPDPTCFGRLPLQVALASGQQQHSWDESLRHLFAAHPFSVAIEDPLTGLPSFCLAGDSLAPIQSDQIEQTAKALGNRSLCWYYLSKGEQARALEEAFVNLDCQKLTAMYEVLRRQPSVLDRAKESQWGEP